MYIWCGKTTVDCYFDRACTRTTVNRFPVWAPSKDQFIHLEGEEEEEGGSCWSLGNRRRYSLWKGLIIINGHRESWYMELFLSSSLACKWLLLLLRNSTPES